MSAESSGECGRRCLWKREGDDGGCDGVIQDDSFTDDDTFLGSLQPTVDPRASSSFLAHFLSTVKHTVIVYERVAMICAFLGIFSALKYGSMNAVLVLFVDALLCLILVVFVLRHSHRDEGVDLNPSDRIRPLVVAVVSTLVLSPVLQSLTLSFSSDSIYLASALLLIVHVYAFEYNRRSQQSVVALNAALFASVLLASRLTESFVQSFAFLLYATMVFGAFPAARHHVTAREHTPLVSSIVLTLCNVVLWALTDSAFLVFYVILAVIVMLFAPMCLVLVQSQKKNTHGNWDEAVPDVTPPNAID